MQLSGTGNFLAGWINILNKKFQKTNISTFAKATFDKKIQNLIKQQSKIENKMVQFTINFLTSKIKNR